MDYDKNNIKKLFITFLTLCFLLFLQLFTVYCLLNLCWNQVKYAIYDDTSQFIEILLKYY